MNPENTNQNKIESKSVHKEDFLSTQKKIPSSSFTIPKDHKKFGFSSIIISILLIIISVSSLLSYVFLNTYHQDITDPQTPKKISPLTQNFYNNNINLLKSSPYIEKTIKSIYDQLVMSKAIGIYELNSGKAIYEQNSDLKLPFGSITKLLTVSTMESLYGTNSTFIMDAVSGNISGSLAGIAVGDEYTYNDALYGMMLPSGNDVALNIANQYGYIEFIKNLNLIANAINLKNTQISNPVGFDDPTKNFSSTKDIFAMSRLYLSRPFNKKVASTLDYSIIGKQNTYKLKNTNELLAQPEVYGLKTGTTDAAGQCLVLYIKIQDREYIAVLIGSSNRFKEGQNIIKWLKSNG